MLIVERQDKVLEILRQRKTAQLEELARELDVSPSTIRRDLEQLEVRGLIDRTRAGAIFRDANGGESHLDVTRRMQEHVEQKQVIGRVAAELIQPQMTVLLDGGSTVVYTAQQITARPIQVVTNSLVIANQFAEDEQVELLLLGGSLYPRTGVMVGPITTGCLADLHADIVLFSLAGIYDDDAFNINLPMAQVEQVMMQQAARSVLLMDSAKFGRKSLVRVCGIDDVDLLISDDAIDSSWRRRLGDRLTVATS